MGDSPGGRPIFALAWAVAALVAGLYLLEGGSLQAYVPPADTDFALAFEAEGPLAGAFLVLVGILGAAAVVQGRRERLEPGGRLLVATFIAGMALVVAASNLFTFILAWEVMSASPGLLLILDARAQARRAGILYLVYSHLAGLALLLGFLQWSAGGSTEFARLAATPMPAPAAVLLVLGCAIKAGVMPFHTWLPEAHPQAPAPVSALMSGAMVALPSYVLIRFVLPADLPASLAVTALLLGAVTSALGSLHSFHTSDIKTILAYTTIAHMGVLFAAFGLAVMAHAAGDDALAGFVAAAMTAYALVHGLAKATLFLIAGEIHHLVGQLDLERLGGLWHASPRLAALSAMGAAALAGLPPFGGFIAELALGASFLAALPLLDPIDGVAVLGALFLMAIGFGAGLAAVAKFHLGVFHGPQRSRPTQSVVHSGALWGLVALTFILGALPGLLWAALGLPSSGADGFSTPLGELRMLPLLVLGTAATLLAYLASRLWNRRARAADPWLCGLPKATPRQTYSANGLVMPYRILFAEILKPKSDLRLQEAPVNPFAPAKGQYDDPTPRFIEPWVHAPLLRLLLPPIERLRTLHRGPVQLYLIIALLTLVGLLFFLPVLQ